jgi:hypothetical protein
MACPMVSIKRGNTNRSTETKTESDLTNRITKTKIEAEIRKKIIKANTGIKISTDIALVPLRTRKSTMAAITRIKTRKKRALHLARIRNTRVAVHLARKRIRTKAEIRNIITNQAQAPKTKTGKIRKECPIKY